MPSTINMFCKSNATFSYEALRAAGYSNYGGADIAEVAMICAKIRPGNEDDWVREWKRAAERASGQAKQSKSVGNVESAYHSYLRASNYFRTAEFFRRADVANDRISQTLYQNSEETFVAAMGLSAHRYEPVSIPYEATTLPGYFVSVDDTKQARRTIIFNGGFDSTMSEGWFAIGAAALARGYNFLAFDGPGQGTVVRKQHLYFRHDWENVLVPVVDYALTRPDVDASFLVIFGWSMGGYLVARGATQEHRARAIILNDGVYDFGSSFRTPQPLLLRKCLEYKYDKICNQVIGLMQCLDTGANWALLNGIWTFGAASGPDFLRQVNKYTLAGHCEKITTPCLVMDAENDHFLKGQPKTLSEKLKCKHELVYLTQDEGADTHCHQGAFFRVHQVIFDYLAKELGS